MAFTFYPNPTKFSHRRDKIEEQMVRRREREAQRHQCWENTSKYFKSCEIAAAKFEAWTSPESRQYSMDAYRKIKETEQKDELLESKKNKLRDLLQKENEVYETHLHHQKMLHETQNKNSTSSTPNENLVMRQQALIENDPIENAPLKQNLKAKCELPVELLQENKEMYSGARSYVPVESPPIINAQTLIEESKLKEEKNEFLKEDYKAVKKKLHDIESVFDQRKIYAERQQYIPFSEKLSRPYKMLLKIKGRGNIELLEFDLKYLNLLTQTVTDHTCADLSLGPIGNEAYSIKEALYQQIKKEIDRLTEVDNLFNEEAKILWERRCVQWENEQSSLNAVMEKITNYAKSILNARLGDILRMQKSTLETHEKLLHQLQQHVNNNRMQLDKPSNDYKVRDTNNTLATRASDIKRYPSIEDLKLHELQLDDNQVSDSRYKDVSGRAASKRSMTSSAAQVPYRCPRRIAWKESE